MTKKPCFQCTEIYQPLNECPECRFAEFANNLSWRQIVRIAWAKLNNHDLFSNTLRTNTEKVS